MNTNPNAKRIMIFGDSLTFGKIPGGLRYAGDKRFTGVMQYRLGADYEIIEEGLRGRTISGENAFFPYRDGSLQFGPIFGSHLPLDLQVLFLGTNDLNSGSTINTGNITQGFKTYLDQIKWWCEHLEFSVPQVLIIAPPIIEEEQSFTLFKDIFKGAKEKSLKLAGLYKEFTQENNCYFFDSSTVVTPSPVDGVHLDEENNRKLGETLADYIKSLQL